MANFEDVWRALAGSQTGIPGMMEMQQQMTGQTQLPFTQAMMDSVNAYMQAQQQAPTIPSPKTTIPEAPKQEEAKTPQYTEPQAPPPLPPPAPPTPPTPEENYEAVAESVIEEPPPTYENPSSPINIDSLLEKLASFSLDDSAYLDKMKGNLRQDVMNSAASQREELANRLAASGIEGGMALDSLSGVDRAALSGMASGLSDLYQNSMDRTYENLMGIADRQIQRQGADRDFSLGTTDREIQLESLIQQFGLKTREDQMQFAQFLIQASMYADQEESQRMMELANALLYGDPAGGV
jgi:hypothetical protein